MRTLIILLSSISFTYAQQLSCQKIGYADTEYILKVMPEFNKAKRDLQLDINQYEEQFNAKVVELEEKLRIFNQGASTMIDVVRMDKENELRRIRESIERFQQEVQVAINRRENELMEPILNRVGRAIDAVAQEHGFDFILNAKTGPLEIVQFADTRFNVSDLVLTKLGVENTEK